MKLFSKKNSFDNDSLIKEAKGLESISNHLKGAKSLLKTPKIVSSTKKVLELEYIDNRQASLNQMQVLGLELAKFHEKEFENFGLEYDNFIGLNPQKNSLSKNWGEFFCESRLAFQISLIKDKKLKEFFTDSLNRNSKKIQELLNDNTIYPSMLHGDLWSGNILFSKEDIYLIDPAFYYGDKEVDIAMTKMFGGFTQEFYQAYASKSPLSKEFRKKEIVYNLYHYLNHFNLFGTSYLNECLNRFDLIEQF